MYSSHHLQETRYSMSATRPQSQKCSWQQSAAVRLWYQGMHYSFDKLSSPFFVFFLPLVDLSLLTTAVSFGLLFDEAWNAKPVVSDELVGQSAETPVAIVVVFADDVKDSLQTWCTFVVAQMWLAIRTVVAFARLASQQSSSNAFDGEAARMECRT